MSRHSTCYTLAGYKVLLDRRQCTTKIRGSITSRCYITIKLHKNASHPLLFNKFYSIINIVKTKEDKHLLYSPSPSKHEWSNDCTDASVPGGASSFAYIVIDA